MDQMIEEDPVMEDIYLTHDAALTGARSGTSGDEGDDLSENEIVHSSRSQDVSRARKEPIFIC